MQDREYAHRRPEVLAVAPAFSCVPYVGASPASYGAWVESRSAQRERLRAEREQLNAEDPRGLQAAWAMIEDQWRGTVDQAKRLSEPLLHERVNGEWSFVQTQRHLVLVTDCWVRRMVKGIAHSYHPWGLGGSWLTAPRHWGLDPDADPSLDEVLNLRRQRMAEVREVIGAVTPKELQRNCVPPPSPGHPSKEHTVLDCLHVTLKEEWQHRRYAIRDLELIERRSG
jgi:hypothetical protein